VQSVHLLAGLRRCRSDTFGRSIAVVMLALQCHENSIAARILPPLQPRHNFALSSFPTALVHATARKLNFELADKDLPASRPLNRCFVRPREL
jgi:hypothetical protein